MLKTSPAFLARLHAGTPKILATTDCAETLTRWLGETVELWRIARQGRSGLALFPSDAPADAAGPPVEIGTPPTSCIAVLVEERRLAERLRRWWRDSGDMEAPILQVNGRLDAVFPELLQLLAVRARHFAEAAAAAQRALVRTRQDYEQTREMFGELVGQLSLRPPETPVLSCEVAPAGAPLELYGVDRTIGLRQPLPLQTQGVTALAIHLAGRRTPENCRLRVRLVARESGRILGSWLQENGLLPGWHRFELPQPILGVQETAMLELRAAGEELDELTLSLGAADALVEGEAVLERRNAVQGIGRPLAFRVWTATVGTRFIRPPGFLWHEVDQLVHPPGTIMAVPPGLLAGARAIEGADLLLQEVDEQRLLAALPPDRRVVLELGDPDVGSCDLLLVDVRVVTPPDSRLRLAAWIVEPGSDPVDMRSLESGAGRLGFTGWKEAPPRGTLTLVQPVPPLAGGSCRLVLAAVRTGGPPEFPAAVEWQAVRLATAPAGPVESSQAESAAAERPALPEEAAAQTPRPETGAPILAAPASLPLLWDEARLLETRRLPSGYAHLGLVLRNLRFAHRHWSEFRFKFAFWRGAPALEFRPGEPAPFRRWPGEESDRHGPLFRIPFDDKAVAEREARLAELDPEDRALIEMLVGVLPEMVEEALAGATTEESSDPQIWLQRAAACRQAMSRMREAQAA